jgi:PKD repeat protein
MLRLNATAALAAAAMLLAACGDDALVGDPANTPPTPAFAVDCVWLTCTFVDGSTDPDGRIDAFAWDFGDNVSSTEQGPTHVYAAPGQFTVTLRVTDDDGATATTTGQVSVSPDPVQDNGAPIADFDVACNGLACGFTDRSTDPDSGGAVVSHAWDFGDGGTSDQSGPFHFYASAGQFTVTLTVRDNQGAEGVAVKQMDVTPGIPPDRSGTYERETSHNAPGHHSRYIIREDGTFALHDLNGPDSTVYAGRWVFARSWGGWPLEGGEVILLDFNRFANDGICGEAFGYFLLDGYLGVSYCGAMIRAGFEEGVYTATPGSSLLPPPQAGQIAFVRDGRIYLANTDGSGVVPLSDGPQDASPAWSPDGQRLAFSRPRNGTWQSDIYVMNADGSNVVRRTTDGDNTTPSWSPDGTRIAFARVVEGQGSVDVYVMTADEDGTRPTDVSNGRGYEAHPAWSPDGTRIAFVSDQAMYDFWFDIWVMAPDGSQQTALRTHTPVTPHPHEQHQPAWSPDGRRLAYLECPWAWDVCSSGVVGVMNADGSAPTRLLATSGYAHPSWSPDGQVIAFGSPNGIEWVSADGSARGRIVANGRSPAWRP